MKRVAASLFLLLVAAGARAETRQLVLVTAANSPARNITAIETRMLYLGYVVERGGRPLQPLRNMSSPLINDVFLQHVVAMSQATFDRRILVAVLQKGRRPPPEYRNNDALLKRLLADPQAISYMWLADVRGNPSLKVLRVLWVE